MAIAKVFVVFLIVTLSISVGLAATTKSGSTKDPEGFKLRRTAWQICLYKEIAAKDNGTSAPSEIAASLQDTCTNEYAALVDVLTESPAEKATLRDDRLKETKEMVEKLVPMVREKANRFAPISK